MSVQLILYPQGHNGVYNTFTNPDTDFITNGINFNNLSSAPTATGSSIDLTILLNPAVIPNSWYRYKWGGGALYPYNQNSNLKIPSDIGTISGLYQRMTDLTYGVQYEAIIDIITPPQPSYSGQITIKQYVGSQVQSWYIQIDETTTQVRQLIGASVFGASGLIDMTIFVAYEENNTSSSVCIIGQIQVQPAFGQSGSVLLDDGQVICDLYEDEDIPLSLSVDEFKNVAEKVQSYSKAFNLPATKRNNRIFDQVFEITRDTPFRSPLFNPYQKTQCVLKQDGLLLFSGYLRLLDITDKEGEISYNVNLYSEAIALADYLKDKTFSELDFTELVHDYNKTNIKNSWNDAVTGIAYTNASTSGFRDAYTTVRYPFVNWSNSWIIANNPSSVVGPTDNNPQLVTLGQAFRPFISIKYIIDRIFQDSPFNYTSAFLNTTIAGGGTFDFEKLYMDFNWGGSKEPNTNTGQGFGENDNTTGITAGLTPTKIPFDVESFSNASDLGFDATTSRFTASFDNQVYIISGVFKFSYADYTGGQLGYLGWEKFDSSGTATGYFPINNQLIPVNSLNAFGNVSSSFNETIILNTGESLRPSFYKLNAGVVLTQLTTQQLSAFSSNGATVTTGTSQTTSETLLENLRGELGQWDFLKGLITMFNLVTLPDEDNPNNIIIEPYSDIFIDNSSSVQLDWTDKIDISEIKLEPLTDLNKNTIFKFVEDEDDSAFMQYKSQVGGFLYGSLMFDAGDEFNILEGLDEIIAEPFAATVVKPLASQFSAFITPALYSYDSVDDASEGFDNSPRIMYNNGIKSTGTSYYIPAQNGLGSENQTDFLQFSHLSDIQTTITSSDFHFGACQLLGGIIPVTDNLFGLYWAPYIFQLYNTNTRIMTIKVNLSPADINTFKFYDTVFIKNRIFRVNKIDYKPNDLATVEFILIP